MTVTYVSFSEANKTLAKAAVSSVSHLLSTVIAQTKLIPGSKLDTDHKKNAKKAFLSFFGGNNPVTVAQHYGYIKKAMIDALTITYDATDLVAKAYIFTADKAPAPGGIFTPDLYLCPALYASYSVLGTNSTLGTIIHELSHLTVSTVDHVYGMRSCVETLTDAQKLTNADNYKYYAEVFQYPKYQMRALADTYDASNIPPKG
jgi:hypothetical protein